MIANAPRIVGPAQLTGLPWTLVDLPLRVVCTFSKHPVRGGGAPGLPLNEKTCLRRSGHEEPFVLMRMATGKENKKQLDMSASVIVNYNSVVEVHLKLIDASE